MTKMRLFHLLAGPVLFLLIFFGLPESWMAETSARAAIGSVAWMAYWWVTAPIDYAVTAFLPIALNAFIEMAPMGKVIANYSSETILLLLGSSIIMVSWEETGVDKRIAAKLLRLVGSGYKQQVIFWFLLSTALSSVLPNGVVCATIIPIAITMLKSIGESDVAKSPVASKLLTSIVYAAGIGGLISPLGGAMNLVTVDYIQQLTKTEYMYVDWVYTFAPIMVVLVASNLFFMLRDIPKGATLLNSQDYFKSEYEKFPKMTFEEKASIFFFVLATVLAFTRQFYKDILPGLKPAYSFITCAILCFLVSRRDGGRLMIWKSVQKKIVWELIYIFAGGLALGTLINASGAAAALGNLLANAGLSGGIFTAFCFIAFTFALSDVTSNTATAAVAIPIVISVAQGLGKDPIPYVYIASIGVNLSYMLPTSIRAIPVGYGLSPKYLFREGWKITLIELVLMTLAAYLFILKA